MKVHPGLICFFFLSLQDGNIGFISAQTYHITGTEGQQAELICPSSSASRRKFLCKETCKQEDILIDTEEVSAQSGRYSIGRRQTSGDVFVNISNLTKSDSGLYRCGVGRPLSSATYVKTEIVVVDALLNRDREETHTLYARNGGNITVACSFLFLSSTVKRAFLCRGEECFVLTTKTFDDTRQSDRQTIRCLQFNTGASVYVSISQLNRSDSGRYRCGLQISEFQYLYREFEVNVADESPTAEPNSETSTSVPTNEHAASPETTEQSGTSTTDILLYVGLTLVALVVLFSLALLIFCRRKFWKPKEAPEETEYANVSEIKQAKYTKPNEIDISSDYSSIPGPSSQPTAEDSSSKLTYSELNFSDRAVISLSSAPHGNPDTVIYSTPR